MITLESISTLDFAKGGGLLPAIVQDAASGQVLMLDYMDREALRATLQRHRVVFYSRSRQRLWEKGESSGNTLELVAIHADCDSDALLVLAAPRGPACHRGTVSCFATAADPMPAPAPASAPRTPNGIPSNTGCDTPDGFLVALQNIIAERLREHPEGSYTATLAAAGVRRVAQKVGEEGVEVALAGTAGSVQELIGESADLLYHLLVLLQLRDTSLATVLQELRRRQR